MKIKRYNFFTDFINGSIDRVGMKEVEDGGYVQYEDYKHLSDYCDHLVEFSKLPCLPKDIEVLRDSNAVLATDNHYLRDRIKDMERQNKFISEELEFKKNQLKQISKIVKNNY